MRLDGVERRGRALAERTVEERLATMDLLLAEALVGAVIERKGREIAARGAGVRRRALQDSRLRFLGMMR